MWSWSTGKGQAKDKDFGVFLDTEDQVVDRWEKKNYRIPRSNLVKIWISEAGRDEWAWKWDAKRKKKWTKIKKENLETVVLQKWRQEDT